MRFHLKNSLFKVQKIAALEVFNQEDNSWQMNLTILEKKKEQLSIVEKQTLVSNLKAISSLVSAELPLILLVNGKGVLQKKISHLPEQPLNIPARLLPEANGAEFCCQVDTAVDGFWISMMRKVHLEAMIEKLKKAGLTVVDVSFGLFSVQHVIPLLPKDIGHLNIGNYQLVLLNRAIESYGKTNTSEELNIQIGDEVISNYAIPSFSVAFQYLLQVQKKLINVEFVKLEKAAYFYHRIFKKSAKVALLGFFALLALNFLIFNWLNSNIQQQQMDLIFHQTQLIQLDSLKNRFVQQQTFIKQNSLLKPSRTSFFADQIGASLPKGIQLSEMHLFPSTANQKQQSERLFLFDRHSIFIKGYCKRSTSLNVWIKKLKAFDWVQNVEVLPYKELEGQAEFELKIIL